MRFTKKCTNEGDKVYNYSFNNLNDLYNYLKSEPIVNKKIFKKQASVTQKKSFAGESLEEAIEYLKGGYKIDFKKFDIAVSSMEKFGLEDIDSRKIERTLHGGAYIQSLVAAGAPDCMIRYIQDFEPKKISVYFQLSYSSNTNSEQIFNRGIATINLIQQLEAKGYIVDLKVFELSRKIDEYVDINISIKQIDEVLNISKCYYPFVSKEFLRRLLFRVLESVPVTNDWGWGYGTTVPVAEIRKFYKLSEKDIVIPAPDEIGIDGMSILKDTVTFFEYLKLDKEFDLSRLKGKQKVKRM